MPTSEVTNLTSNLQAGEHFAHTQDIVNALKAADPKITERVAVAASGSVTVAENQVIVAGPSSTLTIGSDVTQWHLVENPAETAWTDTTLPTITPPGGETLDTDIVLIPGDVGGGVITWTKSGTVWYAAQGLGRENAVYISAYTSGSALNNQTVYLESGGTLTLPVTNPNRVSVVKVIDPEHTKGLSWSHESGPTIVASGNSLIGDGQNGQVGQGSLKVDETWRTLYFTAPAGTDTHWTVVPIGDNLTKDYLTDDLRLMGFTHFYSARDLKSNSGQQSLINRLNRAADDERLIRGSVRGAEITEDGFANQAVANNYASTPWDAVFQASSGLLELRASFTASDYTPSGSLSVGGVFGGASTARAARLVIFPTTGNVVLEWYDGGGTYRSLQWAHGSADGTRLTVRATIDASGADTDVEIFSSADGGGSWSSEVTNTLVGVTGLQTIAGSPVMEVGSRTGGVFDSFDGTVHWFQWIADGTTEASPDFEAADPGSDSVTDAQSNVWTVTSTGVDSNDPDIYPSGEDRCIRHTSDTGSNGVGVASVSVAASGELRYLIDFRPRANISLWRGMTHSVNLIDFASGGFNVYVDTDPGFALWSATWANLGLTSADDLTGSRWQIRVDIDKSTDQAVFYLRERADGDGLDDSDWSGAATHTDTTATLAAGSPANADRRAMTSVVRTNGNGATTHYADVDLFRMKVYDVENDTVDIDCDPETDNGTDAGWTGSADSNAWTVTSPARLITTAQTTTDGTDDYMSLPAAAAPSFTATTGKYTVVMLIRKNGGTATGAFWSSASVAVYRGLTLYANAGSSLIVTVRDDASAANNSTVTGTLNDNEWHVIAGVFDDSDLYAYNDTNGFGTVSDTSAQGTITHATPTIGETDGGGRLAFDCAGTFVADGVALTEAQLDDLAAKMKAAAGI